MLKLTKQNFINKNALISTGAETTTYVKCQTEKSTFNKTVITGNEHKTFNYRYKGHDTLMLSSSSKMGTIDCIRSHIKSRNARNINHVRQTYRFKLQETFQI